MVKIDTHDDSRMNFEICKARKRENHCPKLEKFASNVNGRGQERESLSGKGILRAGEGVVFRR